MSKFSPGDRVRVNYPPSVWHGEECSIIEIRPALNDDRFGTFLCGDMICITDIPPPIHSRNAGFPPELLVPVYDGNEPVSWEDVIWKPDALKA